MKNYDQEEINIGISWHGKKCRAALPRSHTTSSLHNYKLLGIGTSIKLKPWANWRTDLVRYNKFPRGHTKRAHPTWLAIA